MRTKSTQTDTKPTHTGYYAGLSVRLTIHLE